MDEVCSVCGTGLTAPSSCLIGCGALARERLVRASRHEELLQARQAVRDHVEQAKREQGAAAARTDCLVGALETIRILVDIEPSHYPDSDGVRAAAQKIGRKSIAEIEALLGLGNKKQTNE